MNILRNNDRGSPGLKSRNNKVFNRDVKKALFWLMSKPYEVYSVVVLVLYRKKMKKKSARPPNNSWNPGWIIFLDAKTLDEVFR